jgi:hypothetical protein
LYSQAKFNKWFLTLDLSCRLMIIVFVQIEGYLVTDGRFCIVQSSITNFHLCMGLQGSPKNIQWREDIVDIGRTSTTDIVDSRHCSFEFDPLLDW